MLVVSTEVVMWFMALVFVAGCGESFTIENEELDEVEGTCTFTVQYAEGQTHAGRQALTVRPYAVGDGCKMGSDASCDGFRELCTRRIGHREPVYETGRKRE